jgi:polyhydroxybutyrate depolymerase
MLYNNRSSTPASLLGLWWLYYLLVISCRSETSVTQLPPGDHTVHFQSGGGVARMAFVHVPVRPEVGNETVYDMVLNYHALGSTPYLQGVLTGFSSLSDREGFIHVLPQGYDWAVGTIGFMGYSFNAGGCCPNANTRLTDDVAFTRDLIKYLARQIPINKHRIYATGLSNGGFMVNRLACQLSDTITAVASVSGVLATETHGLLGGEPFRPVPYLHFHGTHDLLVPYDGGGITQFSSVNHTVGRWHVLNQCGRSQSTNRVTFSNRSTTCIAICDDHTRNVTLCTVQGGKHNWPGATGLLGYISGSNDDLSAPEQIWAFFKQYTLSVKRSGVVQLHRHTRQAGLSAERCPGTTTSTCDISKR